MGKRFLAAVGIALTTSLVLGDSLGAIHVAIAETTSGQANTAPAKPSGLTGSYIGVGVVNTDQALDFGQQWFRQGNTPTGWFVDQAVQAVQWQQQSAQNRFSSQFSDSKNFQGRLDLKDSPISIRGKVSVSSEVNVIQPIVSYDLAIAPNVNLYAGAGYSFTSPNNGRALPPGNHNSLMVVTGAEAAISKGLVIYGDAQFRMNNPNSQDNSSMKLQMGAGYRF